IALSTDEGSTFGTPKTICPRGSAYSAAVVLPDGTLGVYYEENGVFGGYTMRFVRFSLDWASNGQYKFTEDAPFFPIKSTNETGIDEIVSSQETNADNVLYDLQGRRVAKPTSQGIYIQNGKKVFMNK
ncbi:MAG: sialidase family protein, partial [Bacteroidaceae bacterium]|nr:sialidase family protein [Bacteroidaceae bacterium]